MNLFALSGLLVGLSCTAMSVLVFIKKPSGLINRFWAIFCILVAFWGFSCFGVGCTREPKLALIYLRIGYIGIILIPPLFYNFVTVFLGLRRSKSLIAAHLTSLFFLIVNATPLFLKSNRLVFGQFYYGAPGPLFLPFLIFFLLMISLSHVDLWRFVKQNRDSHRAVQVKWFFMATAIGFTGGVIGFFPIFKVDVYPYGNFAVALYPYIMTYAIIKHQLMDIQIVIRKTIYYSILAFFVSILYALAIFLIQGQFVVGANSESYFFRSIILILFISLLLKPLEIFLHRTLDKKFFKGSIDEIAAERERLELELERRERLKSVGILAAGMAHEIKNPLTAIQTFAEYLPEKYDDPEFREKFSRIVRQEIGRVKEIVSDLLAFSKPSEPKKKSFDAGKLLEALIHLISSDAMKAGIVVESEFEPVLVFADPDQMKQAFLNIIMNAIDAMRPKGGALSIRTKVAGGSAEISIKDTGCGIAEAELAHIFDPFYTNKDDGTGLGLAITHSIIEKNAGMIRVVSAAGKGSEFIVVLPVKDLNL